MKELAQDTIPELVSLATYLAEYKEALKEYHHALLNLKTDHSKITLGPHSMNVLKNEAQREAYAFEQCVAQQSTLHDAEITLRVSAEALKNAQIVAEFIGRLNP